MPKRPTAGRVFLLLSGLALAGCGLPADLAGHGWTRDGVETAPYPEILPLEALLAGARAEPRLGAGDADALAARADALRARAARAGRAGLDAEERAELRSAERRLSGLAAR